MTKLNLLPPEVKCTKFDFGWGSAPDPAGGAYSASPDPLAGFEGPTPKAPTPKGRGGERRTPKNCAPRKIPQNRPCKTGLQQFDIFG